MKHRLNLGNSMVLGLVFCLAAAGCAAANSGSASLPSQTAAPDTTFTVTAFPTETATFEPTFTPTPLTQLTPIIVVQPTFEVPTELAEDFLDQKSPVAEMSIYSPGPNSRISSPLAINAYAIPGADGKVSVQLWGEDGSLMADQIIKLSSDSTSSWVNFSTRFPFELSIGGESVLLTLTTYDGSGRRMAETSVPLILMQMGDSVVEPAGLAKTPFYLQNLPTNSTVSGGTLHLQGYAHPFSSSPLIIELIKVNGGMVASRQVALKSAGSSTYVPFSVDIPYHIAQSTPVRLTMRQMNDQAPYLDLALSSVLITLKP